MEELESRLDRLERRFCANYRHQTEHQQRANLRHMETKLMMKELLKLLETTTIKAFCDVPIQSSYSTPQLEAQPIVEKKIEDKAIFPQICSKVGSIVVEELERPNPFVLVDPVDTDERESNEVACDQERVDDEFIVEGCADVICVHMAPEFEISLLSHKSSFWMSLKDLGDTKMYSQKREVFPIYTILDLRTSQCQDEGNNRPRGMWSVSSILQIDLLDMEPSSTIKIKDANHIFKPGRLDCPNLHTYLSFGDKIRDESS